MKHWKMILFICVIGFVGGFFLSWLVRTAGAQPSRCHILCSYRHPITHYEHTHHIKRCHTNYCRYQAWKNNHNHSTYHRDPKQKYPCIVRWIYNGLHYWHLRYGPRGPYSRNRVGHGSTGYRRCL